MSFHCIYILFFYTFSLFGMSDTHQALSNEPGVVEKFIKTCQSDSVFKKNFTYCLAVKSNRYQELKETINNKIKNNQITRMDDIIKESKFENESSQKLEIEETRTDHYKILKEIESNTKFFANKNFSQAEQETLFQLCNTIMNKLSLHTKIKQLTIEESDDFLKKYGAHHLLKHCPCIHSVRSERALAVLYIAHLGLHYKNNNTVTITALGGEEALTEYIAGALLQKWGVTKIFLHNVDIADDPKKIENIQAAMKLINQSSQAIIAKHFNSVEKYLQLAPKPTVISAIDLEPLANNKDFNFIVTKTPPLAFCTLPSDKHMRILSSRTILLPETIAKAQEAYNDRKKRQEFLTWAKQTFLSENAKELFDPYLDVSPFYKLCKSNNKSVQLLIASPNGVEHIQETAIPFPSPLEKQLLTSDKIFMEQSACKFEQSHLQVIDLNNPLTIAITDAVISKLD